MADERTADTVLMRCRIVRMLMRQGFGEEFFVHMMFFVEKMRRLERWRLLTWLMQYLILIGGPRKCLGAY